MIRWDTYFRVIKQTPEFGAVYPYEKGERQYDAIDKENMDDTCLVIEMSTDIGDKRVEIHREWEYKHTHSGNKYGDVTKWLFSEGKLVGCKYGYQDWFASDHDCGNPECGREWGGSVHSRNVNAFCTNDDGFNVTSLQLSLMFAKELHRITGAYIDAVETDEKLYNQIHDHSTKGGA